MSNISLPLGAKGSGRARYAAAMEQYQAGMAEQTHDKDVAVQERFNPRP